MMLETICKQHRFIKKPAKNAWCFIFKDQHILLFNDHDQLKIPSFDQLCQAQLLDLSNEDYYCFATLNSVDCLAMTADRRVKNHPNLQDQLIKTSYQILAKPFFKLAALGCHLNHWFHTHRFCGRCGAKLHNKSSEQARECRQCHYVVYPRLSPSIIVLVYRGDELLLARSPHFLTGIFSTLAGFVEPGETVEEAVKREVFEEVQIVIKNLRYFGSQPWPFPESLMLAFTAEYASGRIKIDPTEIEAADWFSPNQLPPLPSPLSIARQLIDQHIQQSF